MNEPSHEKTLFLHICENEGTDQLQGYHAADQRIVIGYINSAIILLLYNLVCVRLG